MTENVGSFKIPKKKRIRLITPRYIYVKFTLIYTLCYVLAFALGCLLFHLTDGRTSATIDRRIAGYFSAEIGDCDDIFSFAKRLWGNRLRVIVGGKVSSGENAVNNGQTIIDNVSLEYRLDNTATRYIKLYYDKNYESLLEGELTEMGAGAVFRRKSTKLGDLFIFRKKKK